MAREVIPVREAFFCDGPWYTLASSSLGGSSLTPSSIAERLQTDDPAVMRGLLSDGTCLPLCFPADCALDQAVIIVGDLNEIEQREWLGRLRSKLSIPCGEFLLMAGGLEEDFDVAIPNFEAPDPDYVCFQKVKVPPGEYLVEVYGFLGSATINDAWEQRAETETPRQWWERTRPGQDLAEWITFVEDEEYLDEQFGFLEYLIRLAPLTEEIPLPQLHPDHHWCSHFELRWPDPCPEGIPRDQYNRR